MLIGAVNCNSCRNILTTCCSDRVTIRIKNLSFAITLHDIHLGRGVDVHLCITLHDTLLTTTKDITDGTNIIGNLALDGFPIIIIFEFGNIGNIAEFLWNINCFASLIAFHHVDVDFCVGISFGIETTAIDVVDACSRLDIHRDFTMSVNRGLYATRLQRTRISSFVTTTYEVLNDDGVTAVGLLDVHRDVALNTTFRVITAIDILQDTAGNSKIYVTMDMGIIRTAVNIFDGISGTCG